MIINNEQEDLFLDQIGKMNNHQFKEHIKIDTGMTRLGILKEDIKIIKKSFLKGI